jgi:hypothetical protein
MRKKKIIRGLQFILVTNLHFLLLKCKIYSSLISDTMYTYKAPFSRTHKAFFFFSCEFIIPFNHLSVYFNSIAFRNYSERKGEGEGGAYLYTCTYKFTFTYILIYFIYTYICHILIIPFIFHISHVNL